MSANTSPFVVHRATSNNSRAKYKVAEKLRIVKRAEEMGWIRKTSRLENVPAKNIRRWMSQKKELKEIVKQVEPCNPNSNMKGNARVFKLDGSGQTPTFGHEVEHAVLRLYRQLYNNNTPISTRMLVREWRRVQPEDFSGDNAVGDNAARLRMYRFMKKHNLSQRNSTHRAQEGRNDPKLIEDFIAYTDMMCRIFEIPPERMYNFDETNLPFGMEFRHTIAPRGAKTVSVCSPTHSGRCTAMLGCSATGEYMTPFIIFVSSSSKRNGKIICECEDPQKFGLAEGIKYAVQEKGWMSERVMLQWVNDIWSPVMAGNEYAPTLLILDAAQAHLTSAVRKALAELNTVLVIIPGGYTSKLQPMDVGANKPWKDRVRGAVEDWLFDHPTGTKPNRRFVSHWVKQSWDALKERPDIMVKTWKRIGYTGLVIERTPDNTSETEEDSLAYMQADRAQDKSDSEYSNGSCGY